MLGPFPRELLLKHPHLKNLVRVGIVHEAHRGCVLVWFGPVYLLMSHSTCGFSLSSKRQPAVLVCTESMIVKRS